MNQNIKKRVDEYFKNTTAEQLVDQLEALGVEFITLPRIDVYQDIEIEFAEIRLDGELIAQGNFWEFHPQYQNLYKYGPYIGHHDLAVQIKEKTGAIIFTLTREK